MVLCAVYGCSHRSERDANYSYFRIPTVKKHSSTLKDLFIERRKLWLIRINREDLDQNKANYSRVCSAHFVSGKPAKIKDRNNPDWAPSINMGYVIKSTKTCLCEKYSKDLENSYCSNEECSTNKFAKNEKIRCLKNNPHKSFSTHNLSVKEKSFTYENLLKDITLIKKPDDFWGISSHEDVIVCARWNEDYTCERKVIIENSLAVKVFLKEWKINLSELTKITCIDDISNLLEKVENFKIITSQEYEKLGCSSSYCHQAIENETSTSYKTNEDNMFHTGSSVDTDIHNR